MKVGDLIECPAGIGLITDTGNANRRGSFAHGQYVFVHFLGGWGNVVVYCDTLKVISENR